MIQRIQTLYLTLTAALFIFMLSGTILSFEGQGVFYDMTLSGINEITDNEVGLTVKTFFPSLFSVLVPVLSVITVFLYKKRNLQLVFTLLLSGFIILFLVTGTLSSVNFSGTTNTEIVPGIKLIIPVISLITTFLAYRSIRKDEEIVKSYDRLR